MSKKAYDDNSLVSLKGPDQVRKRPAVIFGSDGVAKSGSRLSSIKSSKGPRIRVRGVRNSCVILVKKRSLSSFTCCFC